LEKKFNVLNVIVALSIVSLSNSGKHIYNQSSDAHISLVYHRRVDTTIPYGRQTLFVQMYM